MGLLLYLHIQTSRHVEKRADLSIHTSSCENGFIPKFESMHVHTQICLQALNITCTPEHGEWHRDTSMHTCTFTDRVRCLSALYAQTRTLVEIESRAYTDKTASLYSIFHFGLPH